MLVLPLLLMLFADQGSARVAAVVATVETAEATVTRRWDPEEETSTPSSRG